MAWVHNEDCVRRVLQKCTPAAATLFSATCRANLSLGQEESLWELLFARGGLRYRPENWAASAAEGEEDNLEPDSWRKAFSDHQLQIRCQGLLSCRLFSGLQPGVQKFQVCSGGLALPQALAQAADGDIVQLAPGYYPHVVLSRPILLVGTNRDCVEIQGICVRAHGVTTACLTVADSKSLANAQFRDDSTVHVVVGSLRIFDCNVQSNLRAIDIEPGASCTVQSCNIEAEQCCFRGSGELNSCRLQRVKPRLSSREGCGAESMIADFRQGRSRVRNCIVDGRNVPVGLKVRGCSSVEVLDSDITACHYGISAQGCRHGQMTSLIVQASRISRCLEAAIRLESAGADVQMLESEICYNVTGVLAEGWRRPDLQGCCLRDRTAPISPRAHQSEVSKGSSTRKGKKIKIQHRRQEPHREVKTASFRRGSRGREDTGGSTKLTMEGCDWHHNQRTVEVVTHTGASSHWVFPFNRR